MKFIEFAEQYGLLIDEIVMDGVIHRVPVVGCKRGRKDGAYCLYNDEKGCAGWIKNFKTGAYQVYGERRISNNDTYLPKTQREANQQNRQQLYDKTAQTADYLIRFIFTLAHTHPYLTKKHIKPHGTYIGKSGALIVLLKNIYGEIRTFQRINSEGFKSYLKNGEASGCFFQFGDIKNRVIVCEGFSTGASIYEATDISTISAMNDSNLVKVASILRKKYGDNLDIIIAGDNDHQVEGNPGSMFAAEAARECNGRLVLPAFTADELAANLTDFNDLMISRGIKIVKTQILY